jgi:hypothetical protein
MSTTAASTLRERVKGYLEKQGYYQLTPKERVQSNKKCLDLLDKIPKISDEDSDEL